MWALNAADGRVRWTCKSPCAFGGPASASTRPADDSADVNDRLYALPA